MEADLHSIIHPSLFKSSHPAILHLSVTGRMMSFARNVSDTGDSFIMRYNVLPSSHEADQCRKATGSFANLLADGRAIAQKHRVDHFLGFRLLHRHFTLQPKEVIVERPQFFDGIRFVADFKPLDQYFLAHHSAADLSCLHLNLCPK